MEVSNHSMVKEFILLGFPIAPHLQILFFAVFLIAFLLVLAENIIIILTVWTTHSLHSCMYFFLSNLSFLEIWYVTVTLPKTMLSFLSRTKQISFTGFMTLLYFFLSLGSTECLLLAVIAYDCYVAICKPFHYSTIMRHTVHLTMGPWLTGFLISGSKIFFMSHLWTQKINHFFCDVSPLLNLACADMERAALMDFVAALFILLMPLSIIVLSYTYIILTVLHISSVMIVCQIAFCTCISHLLVVIVFYATSVFIYVRPKTLPVHDTKKIVSAVYCGVVPLFNPFIYCLRNHEIKDDLQKILFRKRFSLQKH
ncbi:LOW QUALITY PROTEIN: olfactory receptor 6-like [Egretta garzetta]|uniref:LOW QUALITY PROTEIN: olfactory receptor 6-like n=1 Tax=Egretta garzetta TaxID=188379 RepID=UPI00163BC87D|nr:LOW QUALITY PROTEIN: olfactory receptor 6-like [Egretta garzetta]